MKGQTRQRREEGNAVSTDKFILVEDNYHAETQSRSEVIRTTSVESECRTVCLQHDTRCFPQQVDMARLDLQNGLQPLLLVAVTIPLT